MRKFIFIIFSFIISLSTSNAEVINKILIDGNKRVKKDNIGRSIETVEVIKKPNPGENIVLTFRKP